MSDKKSNDPENSEPDKDSEEFAMPEGIAPPPMPKPDLHEVIKEGPTYGGGGGDAKGKKKKKGKKDRSESAHPLDRIFISGKGPQSSRKGCCGCLSGCFVLVIVFFGILFFTIGWNGPARHLMKEYEVVNHSEEPTVTITEAPDGPTAYIGTEIIYNVPQTKVPVAFYGQKITVSGDFWEDVTLTGAKVVGTPTARFAKDLEIWAAEFVDEGITLKGELKGRVMQNSEPVEEETEAPEATQQPTE